MADLARVPQSEIHLLWQEIQAHSDGMRKIQLEQRAENDRLRLKLAALIEVMDQCIPGFKERYSSYYPEEVQNYNPEVED